MHLERQLGNQLLQPVILALQFLNLSFGGIPDHASSQRLFAGFREVFQPGIVGTGMNTFSATEISNGGVSAKALEDNGFSPRQ